MIVAKHILMSMLFRIWKSLVLSSSQYYVCIQCGHWHLIKFGIE